MGIMLLSVEGVHQFFVFASYWKNMGKNEIRKCIKRNVLVRKNVKRKISYPTSNDVG